MTPKSPSFKSVLLFKMQTRQIETNMAFCRDLSILTRGGSGERSLRRRVRPIGPEGSEGTWQTLTSLLQSTHSHAHTHAYKHFLSLQAVLHPSTFPASQVTGRKQVFISSRWAREGGPCVTLLYLCSTRAEAHRRTDQRERWAQGSSLTEAIIKTEGTF